MVRVRNIQQWLREARGSRRSSLLRVLCSAALIAAGLVAAPAVTGRMPVSTARAQSLPPFNDIQFFDYCEATSQLPSWCSAPGIYQVPYPAGSSAPKLLTADGGYTSQWSADGSKMVFEYGTISNPGPSEYLSVQGIGIYANGVTTHIVLDPSASEPTISPDGTEVVYVENNQLLVEVSSSGGTPTQLGATTGLTGDYPYWAPATGKPGTNGLVVFSQPTDPTGGRDYLATVDPTQGASARATQVAVTDNYSANANDYAGEFPSASSDGSTYYFSGEIGGTVGIFSVPSTGGAPSNPLATPSASELAIMTNPLYGARAGANGHLLYYDEFGGNAGNIGRIFIDGSSNALTFSGANADPNDTQSYPTWAPGGGAPIVSTVGPNEGPVAGGESVSITGSGFTGATEVDFLAPDGTVAASATPTAVGDSALTVPQAPNLTAAVNKVGTNVDVVFDVVVKTPSGTSATNANDKYTAKVPVVTSVSTAQGGTTGGPAAGPVSGGETVTLTGHWLQGVTSVSLQPVQDIPFATAPTNVSAGGTILSFTAPNAGTEYRDSGVSVDLFVDLIVSVPVAGSTVAVITSSSTATGADDKFYLVPVAVSDITPHTSPVLGNGAVTISGTDLSNGTVILAPPAGTASSGGCNSGTPLSIAPEAGGSATSLSFVTKDTSPVMGKTQDDVVCDVEVRVPVPEITGASVTSLPNPGDPGDTLTFPAPKVEGLSFHSALVSGNTLLTIQGAGFIGVTRVEFVFTGFAVLPLTATPVSVLDSQITVNVPSAVLDENLLPNPLPTVDVQVQIPDSAGGFISSVANTNDTFNYVIPGTTAPPCNTLQNCNSGTNNTPGGAATATSTDASGSITVTGNGTGGITVGRYASIPVGTPSFSAGGTFFDVRVSTPNAFTSATINDCDLGGSTSVQWWNPAAGGGAGAWQAASSQVFSAGPPACILVTVNSTTAPTLAQMLGTVFVGAKPAAAKPAFTAQTPPLTVAAGATYAYAFAASGNPAPTFALAAGAPAFLSINATTGALAGKIPAGTTTFSYAVKATNSAGSATAGPFTVTVGSSPALSDSIDISVSGGIQYYDSGPTSSGLITVSPVGPAPIGSVTGTATIAGVHGGLATVSIAVVRQSNGTYKGSITLADPSSIWPAMHMLVTPVTTVSRTGPCSVTSSTDGSTTVDGKKLTYRITWSVAEKGLPA